MGSEVTVSRGRDVAFLLIGPAVAASVAFGLVPAVMRLYAEHRGLAGAIDPRLVDIFSLTLNLALLVALFRLRGLRRGFQERREETE